MSILEKGIQREMRLHPWISRELARRLAQDRAERKTTTKEGKKLYMRDYMRKRRQEIQALPSLANVIGLRLKGKRRK